MRDLEVSIGSMTRRLLPVVLILSIGACRISFVWQRGPTSRVSVILCEPGQRRSLSLVIARSLTDPVVALAADLQPDPTRFRLSFPHSS